MSDLALWRKNLLEDVTQIQSTSPLILSLTNYVSMDLVANGLLSLGASPLMAHAMEELSDMISLSRAVVINIGTLDPFWERSMGRAIEIASDFKKPIVLDPVGAGASQYRTRVCQKFLKMGQISVLRGNASEILALVTGEMKTKGVDSTRSPEGLCEIFLEASQKMGVCLAVTGERDWIFDRQGSAWVDNGHRMLTRVTATGCLSSGLVAAFLSVNPSTLEASWHALSYLGVCGEEAGRKSKGPGSFRAVLIDEMFSFGQSHLEALRGGRIV